MCMLLKPHNPLLTAYGPQIERVFAAGYGLALRLVKAVAEEHSGEQPATVSDGGFD